MRVVLAFALVLFGACAQSPGDDEGRVAASPSSSEEAPIFEHERSGHLPIQLIPGEWRRGGRTLSLGDVNEVVLDGRRIGTYAVAMKGHSFAARVKGCNPEMKWSFASGDLMLAGGGGGCPLNGRWTERGQ